MIVSRRILTIFGRQFDFHSDGSCLDVPSTMGMGHHDDMTAALITSGGLSGPFPRPCACACACVSVCVCVRVSLVPVFMASTLFCASVCLCVPPIMATTRHESPPPPMGFGGAST